MFALLPLACEDESTEEEQPTEWTDPDGEAVTWEPARPDGLDWEFLDTTTYIKSPQADLVTVEASSLRMPAAEFAELLSIQPGDAVVGDADADRADTNPIGFMRKVVSVSEVGDEIVIETEAATLGDAFELCDMVHTVDLADFADLEFVAEDGTKIAPKSGEGGEPGAEPNISFDKSNTVLFEGNGLKATATKANFQFAPSFNFDLDFSLAKGLKSFSAVATGAQSAEIEVKLETTQGVEKDFNKTFSAAPIPVPIGPITIMVTPRLVLGCGVDIPSGINLKAGMTQGATVAVGMQFVKGDGVSGIAQASFTLARTGPTFNTGAPLTARCFIRPELHVGLNIAVASAGVVIGLEGFGEVASEVVNNACKFDMDLGIRGKIGVELDAIIGDPLSANLNVFTKDVAIVDNQSCLPLSIQK